MSRSFALIGRELRSYFLSPAGYIIIALFLLITGLVFSFFSFDQGLPASMRSVFSFGTWILLFICPAITMRAIAEERRMGTLEMLMTAPVSESQVMLAKFAAAMIFLACLLFPTAAHVLLLEMYGRPDYGELAAGYLGMLLAGSVYVSSGLLMSVLASSQVVAFLVTLFFWLIVSLSAKLLPPLVGDQWASALAAADADLRLRDFTIGLLDTSNIVFFLSLTLLFLVAAIRALEARRWP